MGLGGQCRLEDSVHSQKMGSIPFQCGVQHVVIFKENKGFREVILAGGKRAFAGNRFRFPLSMECRKCNDFGRKMKDLGGQCQLEDSAHSQKLDLVSSSVWS